VFLYVYPGQYKWLFFFAGIPGLIAICCTFFLKESGVKQPRKTSPVPGLLRFISFIKTSSVQYRKLFSGLLIFTVLNSSDLFILLRAKECGLSDTLTIGSYILYNLVYALTSAPIGALADKMGLKKTFISGLLIFSFVYFGLGLVQETYSFFMLFALYGIYAAATEGISKAWISLVSKPAEIATAIGTLTAFQSICTLLSGIFAGWFWFKFGSSWMFMTTGILTFFVVVYFMLFVPSFKHERST
jgi:MFS family permease